MNLVVFLKSNFLELPRPKVLDGSGSTCRAFDSEGKLYGTFNSREGGPVGGLGKAITPPAEGHGFSRG